MFGSDFTFSQLTFTEKTWKSISVNRKYGVEHTVLPNNTSLLGSFGLHSLKKYKINRSSLNHEEGKWGGLNNIKKKKH